VVCLQEPPLGEGSLVFYSSPTSFPPLQPTTVGLTVEEELTAKPHETTKLPWAKGRAYIFPQTLLHSGDPLTSGSKWILRTDLIRQAAPGSVFTPMQDQAHFALAATIFRRAQLEDLMNNGEAAREGYERAISLRVFHAASAHPCLAALAYAKDALMNALESVPIDESVLQPLHLSASKSHFRHSLPRPFVPNQAMGRTLYLAALWSLSCQGMSYAASFERHQTGSSLIEQMDDFAEQHWPKEELDKEIDVCDESDESDEENEFTPSTDDLESTLENIKRRLPLHVTRLAKTHTSKPLAIELDVIPVHYKKEKYGCGICGFSGSYEKQKLGYDAESLGMKWAGDATHHCTICVDCDGATVDQLKGTIELTTLGESFNHASCNCEVYKTVTSTDAPVTLAKLVFDLSFCLDGDKLTILSVPKVIM